MNLIESIRAEVERRANAASNTILARVLSMRIAQEKYSICNRVGHSRGSMLLTDYERLKTRWLKVKLQLHRLGYREGRVIASTVFEFGARRCEVICRLLDERDRLALECEAAKRDLFYGEE